MVDKKLYLYMFAKKGHLNQVRPYSKKKMFEGKKVFFCKKVERIECLLNRSPFLFG